MEDRFSLKGRIALVTGAASGMGARFAEVLAEQGAQVICTARRKDRIEAVAARIKAQGGQAAAVTIDVSSENAVKQAFCEAERIFGAPDIVVNAAGIKGEMGPVHLHPTADWHKVMATNLTGMYLVCKEAAQRMIAASKPGNIVVITSIGAERIGQGIGAYCAAKAGCWSLVRSMAVDLVHYGIRINAITPGTFETEMLDRTSLDSERGRRIVDPVPIGRVGNVKELDGALMLLASNASSYITGTQILVDGGLLTYTPGWFERPA